MDAFDADVLIYAVVPDHGLGVRVRSLFAGAEAAGRQFAGVGSVLLVPELLTKPTRDGALQDIEELASLLGRIDLRPADRPTAELATSFGAKYRLRAADAIHLATAVGIGADRFVTNNSKDFPKSIDEIDITYPLDLPAVV